MPAQTAPTLRDDWRARRRQLLASTTLPQPYVKLYVRLLDYLLHRYGDTDVGAQPARFPRRAGAECNLRAVLVHQHLAQAAGRAGRHGREAVALDEVQRLPAERQALSEAVGALARGEPAGPADSP